MIYYHRTTASAANAIFKAGFRDSVGRYLTDHDDAGVWLSDVPLDGNEGAQGDTLLAVVIAASHVEPHEWVEEGKPYREFLVPADVINTHGCVQAVAHDDELISHDAQATVPKSVPASTSNAPIAPNVSPSRAGAVLRRMSARRALPKRSD